MADSRGHGRFEGTWLCRRVGDQGWQGLPGEGAWGELPPGRGAGAVLGCWGFLGDGNKARGCRGQEQRRHAGPAKIRPLQRAQRPLWGQGHLPALQRVPHLLTAAPGDTAQGDAAAGPRGRTPGTARGAWGGLAHIWGRVGPVCHPRGGEGKGFKPARVRAGSGGEAAGLRQRRGARPATTTAGGCGRAERGPAEHRGAVRGRMARRRMGGSGYARNAALPALAGLPGPQLVRGWDSGRRAGAVRCCGTPGTAGIAAERSLRVLGPGPGLSWERDGGWWLPGRTLQGTVCAAWGLQWAQGAPCDPGEGSG